MMIRFFILSTLFRNVEAFHVVNHNHDCTSFLSGAAKGGAGDDGPVLQQAFAEGTFVEFEEKREFILEQL